jgi:glycosyltransferase involved in cell wall biosynthesis
MRPPDGGDVRVSIIVATYGSTEWEERGEGAPLRSAAAQYPLEAFAHHLYEGTLAQTRNEAAAAASGDWLCFLDGDDELAPGYLAAHYREYNLRAGDRPPVAMTAHLFVPAVSYRGHDGRPGPAAIPNWGRPLEEINCAVIGTLIHRDVFAALGGFREWPMYEDWDLWLRAVRYGCSLVPVPDAVYVSDVRQQGRNSGPDARQTYDAIREDLGIGAPSAPRPVPVGAARLPRLPRRPCCGGSQ